MLQAHSPSFQPYLCHTLVSILCRWLFQIAWLLQSLNFSPPKISSSSLSHVATHFCGHSQDFAQWLNYLSNCKNVWTKLFRQRCSGKESFCGGQPFLITENMSFHVPDISLLRILLANSFCNLVHISVHSKAEYATWIFIQSNRVANAL